MPVSKTNQMLKIELLLDEDLSRFLRIEYEQRGLTLRQISKKIEKLTGYLIDPVVISRWLKRLGIEARKMSWDIRKENS